MCIRDRHKAEELKRNASVEGRVKSENRQDLLIVDAINEAINARKNIGFQYFAYNIRKQKKLRHDGERYILSLIHIFGKVFQYFFQVAENTLPSFAQRGNRTTLFFAILRESFALKVESSDQVTVTLA